MEDKKIEACHVDRPIINEFRSEGAYRAFLEDPCTDNNDFNKKMISLIDKIKKLEKIKGTDADETLSNIRLLFEDGENTEKNRKKFVKLYSQLTNQLVEIYGFGILPGG